MNRLSAAILAAFAVASFPVCTSFAIEKSAADASAGSDWLRVEATQERLERIAGHHPDGIDYGSFQWLPATALDAQAVRNAGIVVNEISDAFAFDLGGRHFDPLQSIPAPIAPRASDDGRADWRLVQFQGPIKPEWLERLRADGAIPAQYVHPYGYVVWSDAAALARSGAREEIRWSGDFQTAYRVLPHQRGFDAAKRPTMVLISRHRAELAIVNDIEATGARIETVAPVDENFSVVQLDVAGDRLVDLARITGVYSVQDIPATGGPRGEMSNQSIVGAYGAAPTYTIIPGYASWLDDLGYNGTGVIVSVVDGGIRTTHPGSHRASFMHVGRRTPTSCSAATTRMDAVPARSPARRSASPQRFPRGQESRRAELVQQRYSAFSVRVPAR